MVLNWVLGNLGKRRKGKPAPPYEEAKKIAAKGDAKKRGWLAKFEDLAPEILYFFASDKSAAVRRAVAGNDGTPLQADLILAKDVDEEVRTELAHKIGRLVPSLTKDENEKLTTMAFQVLEILAQDELPRVRAIISEEIKHLSNVPKPVVRRLAHDLENTVSTPVLEYSPLLTEQELFQIIAGGVQGGALEAIARRRDISEQLSDAVFAEDDTGATTELLKNDTASISEKTLDSIAVAAADKPNMHLPLVNRASLSMTTIRRIATFVSNALLEDLISVHEVRADVARELRMTVRNRLESGKKASGKKKKKKKGESPKDRAVALHKQGKLDEDALLDALDDGDVDLVRYGLALKAKLDMETTMRMLDSDNGKAVTALVWKAGLSMAFAVSVQRRISQIQAKSMVKELADGGFPLDDGDMEWFLDYFSD